MKNIIMSVMTAALLFAGFGLRAQTEGIASGSEAPAELSGDDKAAVQDVGIMCLELQGVSAKKIKDNGIEKTKKFLMDNQPTTKMPDKL